MKADLLRQERTYDGREAGLVARRPGKAIGVCAGEAFVGEDGNEAPSMADAAHPDRPVFMSGKEKFCGCR